MSERYKVLGAVLALKEFNVADIAKFSGVKPNTVRTVFVREAAFFDELGKEQSGSRGGRFARYRLKQDKVDDLRSEIRQLYDTLESALDEKRNESNSEYSVPLPLLTAADALLLRFPAAGDMRTKIELIKFAQTIELQQISRNRRVAKTGDQSSEALAFHLHSLRILIDFCNAELVTERSSGLQEYVAPIFRDLFHSLLKRGQQLGQANYCLRLLDRFLTSPLLGPTAQSRDLLDDCISLVSALEGSSDPRATELIRLLRNLPEAIEGGRLTVAPETTDDVSVDTGPQQNVENARSDTSIMSESVEPGKLPLSISIETLGGVACPIFARNTPLPARRVEVFSTAVDNQTEVEVALFHGERYRTRDNQKLGAFKLSGIPPAPRGLPQIEVTFDIDGDGILHVTAKDRATGTLQRFTIASNSNLNKEDVDRIAKDAETHAAEDKEQSEQKEARNSLDLLAYNVGKMLKDSRGKVQGAERSEVESLLAEAHKTMEGNSSVAELKAVQEKLTAASHKMAEVLYKANLPAHPRPVEGQAATGVPTPKFNKDQGVIDREYVDVEKWR